MTCCCTADSCPPRSAASSCPLTRVCAQRYGNHIWQSPRPPSTSRRPTTGASRRSLAPRTAPRPRWCAKRWLSTPAAMRPAPAPRASAPAGAAAVMSPSGRRNSWAAPAAAARPLPPVVGLLQALDVELLHLHHRLHDPGRLFRILVPQELAQHGGHDLPRHAELVLEPAALVLRSAAGQLLPQLVHLLLRLTVHEQRYRRREFELGAAVQGVEVLALELERAGHDGPLGPGARVSIARHAPDLRVLENRHVEVHRLFGVAVEPQEWDDLLHGDLVKGRAAADDGPALPSPRRCDGCTPARPRPARAGVRQSGGRPAARASRPRPPNIPPPPRPPPPTAPPPPAGRRARPDSRRPSTP